LEDREATEALERLVERTRGGQPWRRLFHAANGVLIATVLVGWPMPDRAAAGALLTVTAALLAFDFVRLSVPAANELFFRMFTVLVSPREAGGVASSTWYMMGVTSAVVLFPRHEAISGVLVLALADPAASYIGRRWGRRPFLGGTIAGSTAFLAVALAVLAVRHTWPVALAVAPFLTLLERRSWPLDDNLTVPVAGAASLAALAAWI